MESGGLLIGSRTQTDEPAVIQVYDFEPVKSEHAAGPSYVLSDRDRLLLAARIAAHQATCKNSSIVGFYRSHMRPEFAITEEDAALFSIYFKNASDVILLIKPNDDRSLTGGFIIRESGAIVSKSPYVAGLRITDARVQSLLAALCIFRLLPNGFTNRDLRSALAPLRGQQPDDVRGQTTYDLRRLRAHHMIERIPHTHRYRVTDDGIRRSLFLTRLHQHFLIPGIAQVTGSSPPMDTRLRAVSRAYETAIDELANNTGLAA